jgi:predicted kinase
MMDSESEEKINSNNKDILDEITKELNKIIEYIQINLINIENKDINLDEKET